MIGRNLNRCDVGIDSGFICRWLEGDWPVGYRS